MGKDPSGGLFYADSPTLLCNPVDPSVAACFDAQEQMVIAHRLQNFCTSGPDICNRPLIFGSVTAYLGNQ